MTENVTLLSGAMVTVAGEDDVVIPRGLLIVTLRLCEITPPLPVAVTVTVFEPVDAEGSALSVKVLAPDCAERVTGLDVQEATTPEGSPAISRLIGPVSEPPDMN